jgi:Protein of unknown function (DUF3237)
MASDPSVVHRGHLRLHLRSINAGATLGGTRVLAGIDGELHLDGLRAEVLAPSADWALALDGVTQTSVRAVLRTDDDVVLFMEYHGRSGPAGARAAITFEVVDERYAFLNAVMYVGVGTVDRAAGLVSYELFDVG